MTDLKLHYQQLDTESNRMLEHKDSFDSGVFEADEKSSDDLYKENSTAAQIEIVYKDELSIDDECLGDECAENSNSFYDILDKYPKLEFEDLKIVENTEESCTERIATRQAAIRSSNQKIEKNARFAEDQEILQFIQNRNLSTDQQVYLASEFEDCDEFLYYYKSFHSPLIDKEFDGFSLDHIKHVTKKSDDKKKEQVTKRLILDALQVRKDKQVVADWRERYKNLKRMKEKEFTNNEDLEVNLDPPYATDPDWSLATSSFEDKIYSPANKDVKIDDVAKATEALEKEFDKEIGKVIASTESPGSLSVARLQARSDRIGRIELKLEKVKRKARALSAHHVVVV